MKNEKELEERLSECVREELRTIDAERAYDDMLDECYDLSRVGGPFECMSASRVLRECDPVAYRCGLNDYTDSMRDEWEEIDGDYYDKGEVDDIRERIESEIEAEDETAEDEAAAGGGK